MKTVRKCILAMLSTVSIAVAAYSVQAQSLPGAAEDPNPRSSAFPVENGQLPFNPIRQAPASGDGPPIVRDVPAPAVATPPVLGLPESPQVVGAGTQSPQTQPTQPQQQLPLPAPQVAPGSVPLAYMAAAPATQPGYAVAPTGYPTAAYGPAPGYAQPAMGYAPMPMQAAGYPQPGMGYPPQGLPPASNWATQANYGYGAPKTLPPGAGGIGGPAGAPGGQSFCGCGGRGCSNCGFGHGFGGGGGGGGGFMAGLLGRLLPYTEGGQCAPRWYDITVDAMYLKRDETSRQVNFTADGPGPDPNIIMSTDDLNFDEQIGFRFNAAVQVLSTATAEFTYFGLFSWNSTDSRADPAGGLFSPISQFAQFPPGGFPQTDNAIFHSIAYSSSFDNFELNFRRRYTAPNCRVQASFLAGVRYFYLLEDFRHFTEGLDTDPVMVGNQAGTMDYNIRARNSLTGFQVGGDLWSTVVPGIKAGGELKAGVFGNYGNQTTVILATEPDATYNENADMNDIAVMADANLMVIWRVNPNWTLRAGYFMMYVDGVALAPEQFNSTAPPNLVSPSLRTQETNDNGSAFYHGGFAGLEWQW